MKPNIWLSLNTVDVMWFLNGICLQSREWMEVILVIVQPVTLRNAGNPHAWCVYVKFCKVMTGGIVGWTSGPDVIQG